MAKKTAALLPATDELLRQFGTRLGLARRRRRLTAKQVAERAGMTPMTLRSLERGGSGVTIGAYLAVMQVLGIARDLNLLADADPVGRQLQDAHLPAGFRSPAKRPAADALSKSASSEAAHLVRPGEPKPRESTQDWIKQGGYTSSEDLLALLDPLLNSQRKVR